MPTPCFDLAAAAKHLADRDDCLKRLIAETVPIPNGPGSPAIPYEALLEAIAYQSISGKAAATIYGRVKALSATGRAPTPQEMLKLRKPVLRKAGLSGAKVLAMKDLAKKTIDGVVPTLEQAEKLSDEELVERLVSSAASAPGPSKCFLIFRLGRPDVLPIHDLGRKKRLVRRLRQKHMPKPKELLAFGERWRPYRTVASLVPVARLRARRLIKPPTKSAPPKYAPSTSLPLAPSNAPPQAFVAAGFSPAIFTQPAAPSAFQFSQFPLDLPYLPV